MADMAGEPFILPGQYGMPGLHAKVLEACDNAGFVPRAVQKDVWLMQTVIGLVAAGIGVALVPASEQRLPRSGMVYRPLRGDGPIVELGAAWRLEDRSPVLASFLDVMAGQSLASADVAAHTGQRSEPLNDGSGLTPESSKAIATPMAQQAEGDT